MPNKTAPKTSQDAIFPIFSSYNQFFTLTLQANKKRRMKNIFKIKKEEKDTGPRGFTGIRTAQRVVLLQIRQPFPQSAPRQLLAVVRQDLPCIRL